MAKEKAKNPVEGFEKSEAPKKLTMPERVENLKETRRQLENNIMKVQGAIEVLEGMLSEKEGSNG